MYGPDLKMVRFTRFYLTYVSVKNVRCTSFKWENGSISMQDGAGSYQRSA